jgi:DNA-binding GntR family transcriptional regulator
MATATRKTTARRAPARVTGALDEPVFQGILRAVMDRRLPPGTRLGEEVLCGIYGVSRTVVRKALQRLAQMAVVDMVPHKGASVAAPTPEETREVFEARQAIEAAIVPLAIRHARPAQLDALRVRLAAEHEALHAQDHANWVRLAGEFHLALADMAGNRVLTRVLHELMSRCSLIVALYEAPGDAACEHDEHAQLVDFIAQGDAPAAIALMAAHLSALEQRLSITPRAQEGDLVQALRPR